ncbi:MAG TPA: ankyrin repeat domain-containing protein, partial [Planctomycetaceae bacterium]|nr:ankyrin repeat domain-containing protein [Planctomycetaceae bacterium]
MSRSAGQPSEETARFHRIVTEGDLDELQAALKNGVDVNAPGHVGATALMLALESKDLEKTKLLIQYGADPELTDDFNATALRRAVGADFAD